MRSTKSRTILDRIKVVSEARSLTVCARLTINAGAMNGPSVIMTAIGAMINKLNVARSLE
jgi:hypothetical protein